MTARKPVVLGLGVPLMLLAALVVLFIASQTGTLSSLGYRGLGSAPAAPPANGGHSTVTQPSTGSGSQVSQSASNSGSQTSTTTPGNPPAAVKSGGAEDAGPDVVGQAPTGKSSVCAPKLCRP